MSKSAEQARKAALNAEFRSVRDYKVCLHPDAGAACSSEIIAAHTVQRVGGGLSLIARKNKVYGYDPDIFQLDRTGGRISPKLLEIRRASTFTAFCGKHDKELFAPVEDEPFTGSFEQVALLSFRAVAHELWEKTVKVRTHELFDRELKNRGCLPRFLAGRVIGPMKKADRLDLALAERVKAKMDDIIRTEQWQQIEAAVVWFDQPLPVMCAGATYPRYDFHGRALQSMTGEIDTMTISTIGAGGRGAVVFAWPLGNAACRRAIESLFALTDAEVPAAVARFIAEHLENHYLGPDWWDSLTAEQRSLFLNHVNRGLPPLRPHESAWLTAADDLNVKARVVSKEVL